MTMMRNPMPAGHTVLVKLRKPKENKTDWGFEIASTATQQQKQLQASEGYVIELGMNAFKGFDKGNNWCEVGDLVLFPKYAGYTVEGVEDGEIYQVLNDEDVKIVFRGERNE